MDMDIRDYFAAHCPFSWLDKFVPRTIGGIRDALIKEGIIPADRAKYHDVCRSYNDEEYSKLLVAYRWKYAELMMERRQQISEWESEWRG